MSASYVVAPAAQRDIRAIYDYIARRSPQNAAKVVWKLYSQFDRLAAAPGIGHTRPELGDDTLRTISVYRYLVIYDPSRDPLGIIRVIHGAMDLGPEFRR